MGGDKIEERGDVLRENWVGMGEGVTWPLMS